jgi:hypothetical protein
MKPADHYRTAMDMTEAAVIEMKIGDKTHAKTLLTEAKTHAETANKAGGFWLKTVSYLQIIAIDKLLSTL